MEKLKPEVPTSQPQIAIASMESGRFLAYFLRIADQISYANASVF